MSRLFTPVKLGNYDLQHRIVLAPLTRFRSDDHVPQDRVATYYGQRASPGGLLITEATFIALEAGGLAKDAPGIWSEEQVGGWRKVAEAVHKKQGIVFMQVGFDVYCQCRFMLTV